MQSFFIYESSLYGYQTYIKQVNFLKLNVLIITCLIFWGPFHAIAQSEDDAENKPPVIRDVRFNGNENVKNSTMFELVRTKTNREFFGIPRITPWYFLWKLNIKIGKRLGNPPVRLDRDEVGRDLERITTYYRAIGFRDVVVDSTIKFISKNKVRVIFNIEENEPYILETLTYDGLPENIKADSLGIQKYYTSSKILKNKKNDSTFTVNQRFSNTLLTEEQQRLITHLKNNGYAEVKRDSVRAFVRPDSTDSNHLHALFLIFPGKKYKFGDIYLNLEDNVPPTNYDYHDSLKVDDNYVYINKETSANTKDRLLLNQLRFKPGDIFNNEAYLNTVNDFQRLNMLNIQQFGLSEDAGLPDFQGDEIPVAINMATRPRNNISMEAFGLQRFGLGLGSGISYTNNNLFKSAERLEVSANGSFEFVSEQAIDRNDLTNVENEGSQFLSSFEGRVEYSVPRLNFPFAKLDNKEFFRNSRTRYSIAFASSNQLNFDINSDILLSLRYEVSHDRTRTSFLDLIELDWLEADPTDFFINSLEDQFDDEDNSLELDRILEDFRSQISSLVRYTFRNVETDIVKKNRGEFEEYSVALGGNIPFLIDRFIVTPDTVESTIPGIFGISGNRLSYSQFFKATADYRRYYSINDESTFAIRGFAGFVHPYGKNTTIPLNRRFFAGGTNDIRGYAPNNLGPGDVPPADVTINGGEVKLAAFTEYRNVLFRDVFAADWIGALYTDAGNIWYGPRNNLGGGTGDATLEQGRFKFDEFFNQIAVSSGFGLRVDFQYVVMRFDFTRRIHDLQEGWFNNKNLFFTFGIGHSF